MDRRTMDITQQTLSDNNTSSSVQSDSGGVCEECGSHADTMFYRKEHGEWIYEYFLCADCACVIYDDDPIDLDEDRGV